MCVCLSSVILSVYYFKVFVVNLFVHLFICLFIILTFLLFDDFDDVVSAAPKQGDSTSAVTVIVNHLKKIVWMFYFIKQ